MKPKLLLCLVLVLLAGLTVFAESFITRLQPTNIGDTQFSVKVGDADFGKRFIVFYRTNGYTLDEFLHAQLDVCSENQRIASSPIEKTWTTNGVQFEFTVSTACLSASEFTITEQAHSGKMPRPGFDKHWCYLRDFVTNSSPTAPKNNSSN
ncbi:MAG: hypothetical protein ACREGC_02370 [Minisyncoccia bacterium]